MLEKSTYYVLDAQGNQLSMYDHQVIDAATVYYLSERNIYGSERLGMTKDTVNMFASSTLPSYGVLGNRQYEMSNHLGNVLSVVNDIVYPVDNNTDETTDYYQAGIVHVADYSPYGVLLNERTLDNNWHIEESSTGSSTSPTVEPAPVVAEIYKHLFNDSPNASPYTTAPTTLDANLSSIQWVSSTSDFDNYTGVAGTSAIAISSTTPDTSIFTLSMTVASGKELDVASYSFYNRRSSAGYTNYKLLINGINVGTGSIGTSLASTGTISVANPVTAQTGTVNVVLKLYGGSHGSSATFRMDDFILNGYTKTTGAVTEETLYTHLFNDSPNASPYTTTPNTLHSDLSSTQWVSSTSDFDNYAGVSSTTAIAISTATSNFYQISMIKHTVYRMLLKINSYST